MTRIVLVMHAPLGSAFVECAQHVLGHTSDLAVFDVQPNDKPDLLIPELLRQLLHSSGDPVLILCDIYGATPFNIAKQALKLSARQGVQGHLITGTNLCMVLKALTGQHEDLEQLTESVRLGAVRGIIDAEPGA